LVLIFLAGIDLGFLRPLPRGAMLGLQVACRRAAHVVYQACDSTRSTGSVGRHHRSSASRADLRVRRTLVILYPRGGHFCLYQVFVPSNMILIPCWRYV
jgi:hypothetical protein